ncbi:hypothetical protein CVT24_011804 [Panaeolus cyanescens]|uniref:Uncharacterized protein n=1 Tax=Panaeolus cyanescens TaxID=181874 RepID=A0A409VHE3_9AGAR|nr:hypothetical protein CVT24_011804 [Panaeolus cyanescens]
MDGAVHSGASTSTSGRKRSRETETESQKIKREKAAERQRRKRERDRNAALQQQQLAAQQQQEQLQAQQQAAQQQQLQPIVTQPPPPAQPEYAPGPELTEAEKARRDKVRAAARDRQRKHRMLVKQRRMRELGIDMGNEMLPGMEEVHYRPPDGQYHQVLPPELQQQMPPPHAPQIPPHEPPFPQGAVLGGQTFASTLLLSFSCTPLLKQHLLRTLGMSNEELASLEPIIAEAWDHWDHQRRLHYAEQVAKNGGQPPGIPAPPAAYPVNLAQHDPHAPPHAFPHPSGPPPTDPNQAANDFRARFHRSILAPTPFRSAFAAEGQAASANTPSSAGSAPVDAIDPHLATNGTEPAASKT